MPGLTTAFAQGTLAARPAASSSNNGYEYFASDTGGGTLYQSNGSSWVQIGMALNGPLTTKGDLIAGGASGASTRLGVGSDTQVLTADSTQTLGVKWAAPGSGLYSASLCYQDQQTQNTNGGTFTSGAWRTRTLNTEVADTASHGSVASNQITLDAGTYRVLASAPAYACGRHQLRLQNITDSSTLVTGLAAFAANPGGASNSETRAWLAGRFTTAASKTIELQHQCEATSATIGLGVACNFTTEIFACIELFKE